MSEVIRCPDAHQTMWKALGDKEYRDAFAEAHAGDFLASQIYSMRLFQDWNQTQLAEKAGVTQPMISRFEKSCEGVQLTSLFKVASAFDVAVLVKFVPFSVLARESIDTRADLPIPSYDQESPAAISFPAVRLHPPEPRGRPASRNATGYFRIEPQLGSKVSAVSMRV